VSDPRIAKFAKVLVEHSARIVPGDRVLIEGTTAAEPLIRELYIQILEKGGYPHPVMGLPGTVPFMQEDLYLTYAKDSQLDFMPIFYKYAYDQFESRIRIHSATNTRATTSLDPLKVQRRAKAISGITESQMRRGAEGVFKWVTTLYPTDGYAQDAGMSLQQYEDFVFGAVHAHEEDPIAYWNSTAAGQQKVID
jgi:aminopeptidase